MNICVNHLTPVTIYLYLVDPAGESANVPMTIGLGKLGNIVAETLFPCNVAPCFLRWVNTRKHQCLVYLPTDGELSRHQLHYCQTKWKL